jgi:hypothetical protein
MKIKWMIVPVLLVLAVLYNGCTDIVEPNLAKTTLTVDGPGNNIVSSSNSITFWWEPLKGADNYRLSVVRPNFSSVQQLIFDTTITYSKFSYTFTLPGTYQWRVRAQNGGTQTPYVTYTFTIDTTSNLATTKVPLNLPIDNASTDVAKMLFQWSLLPKATNYTLEIWDSTNTSIYTKALITTDTASYTFVNDGKYHWGVQGLNGFSITSSTNIFYVTLNRTGPNAPTLTYPTYNDTTSTPVNLQWQRTATVASITGDSVVIASDSLFTGVLKRAYVTSKPAYSYSFTDISGTPYFWRVKSVDASGNRSGWSSLGKFRAK